MTGYRLDGSDQLTSDGLGGLGGSGGSGDVGGVGGGGGSDPMAGLVNLVDVMLVFACGLMLALVTYWNLDLPTVTEIKENRLNELNNADEMVKDAQQGGNAYIERGIVYQDPATGKLYWMEDVSDEGGNK